MLADPYQVMMLNVALALKEIGYEIEVIYIYFFVALLIFSFRVYWMENYACCH